MNGVVGSFVLAVLLAVPLAAESPAADREPARGAAAVVAGQEIEAAAVDELIRPQLMELRSREQQLREQALEVLIARTLMQKEAAARGISEDALESQEVTAKSAVSVAEAKAFYDANKERFGTTPEAEALPQIQQGLFAQRQGVRRADFAQELRKKYEVTVLLEPMRVAVDLDGAPVRGNASAPVTIVEFSDFECPFCVRARPTVARVREAYGARVRWAFRHFPLSFHAQAQKAGEAAACAGEQGRFWEMHDRLWASAGKLQVAELKAAASAAGLERAAFDRCLDSGQQAARVARDEAAGESYGVSGTPAFFVNGRPLVGAQPFESFQRVIDDELRRIGGGATASK